MRVARWLPLYLVAVAALTLFPFSDRLCAPQRFASLSFGDLLANVILFVPLGLGLRLRSSLAVASAAALLSVGIELAQVWLPRVPNALDVVWNSLGAVIGHRLRPHARRLPHARLLPDRDRGTGALVLGPVLLALVIAAAHAKPANDFSSWKRFPVQIGNESGGERPWWGRVSEIRIYDRAVPPEPDPTGSNARPWSQGGPILTLRFGDELHVRSDGPEGPRSLRLPYPRQAPMNPGPGGLDLVPSVLRLPPVVSEHLLARLRSRHELTATARVSPSTGHMVGPARIVSFSAGPLRSNWMLGQEDRDVVFLVRTPLARSDPPVARTASSPLTPGEHAVRALHDGLRSVIWVDGECRLEALTSLEAAPFPFGWGLGLAVVTSTSLFALSASRLPLRSVRRAPRAACGLGAIVAWVALWQSGAWSHLPGFDAPALGLGAAAWLAALPLTCRAEASGRAEASVRSSS